MLRRGWEPARDATGLPYGAFFWHGDIAWRRLIRISTKAGERIFVPPTQLRQVLDLDEEQYKQAVRLLCEAEPPYLEAHRREHAPARGFLLPRTWGGEDALHLRRIARDLLAEADVVSEDNTLGKVGRIFW